MLLFRLLYVFLHWCLPLSSSKWCKSVFTFRSNPCSCFLCLWELFLVCSVLSLSVSQGATEVSLGLLSWSAPLVNSLGSLWAVTACASKFHSWSSLMVLSLDHFCVGAGCVSEFHQGCQEIGEFGGWSGTCSLQGTMD